MNYMSSQKEQAITALETIQQTVGILAEALSETDEDKPFEAVTILLMQVTDIYGEGHPVFQQYCPVIENIKQRIDCGDREGALRQTTIFGDQLREVVQIVQNSE
jgi:hypothetical protein